MNGFPMMHMTIPEEIQAHFKKYILDHPQLSEEAKNMLNGYAGNMTLMQIMGFTFFEQWQDERNFTVEAWTLNVIEELLAVMEVTDL